MRRIRSRRPRGRLTPHLDALPTEGFIPLEPDQDGYLGRECPEESCRGYFKVDLETVAEAGEECRCPYCGFEEDFSHFHTQAQIDYTVSVVNRRFLGAMLKDLKAMECDIRPRDALGIGMSMRVQARLPRIKAYRELDLETEVLCGGCALRYAIYGVFGFCPGCGSHNNLTILEANLDLARKMIGLGEASGDETVRRSQVESALGVCVAAFDAWGRAVSKMFAAKARESGRDRRGSFQNIRRVRERLRAWFGFDMVAVIGADDFDALHRTFQKRHLLAHTLGVVDQTYIDETGDRSTRVGRRIRVEAQEVERACARLRRLAKAFVTHLEVQPERGAELGSRSGDG